MTRHIGAQTLARFRQDDLSRRRSSRIRAHLAGCARCSDLNEDLAGVTTLLAHAAPPPIPEHLSARIHTALAVEAAKRAALTAATPAATSAGSAGDEAAGIAAPDAPAPRPGERSPRHERPARRGSQPRVLRLSSPVALRTMAAAAAAVVIAGGAYEVVQHVGGSTPSSSPAHGFPGPAAAPRLAAPESNAAGSATAPPLHYEHAGRQDSVTPVKSGTNYAPTTLSSQVSRELRQNPTSSTGLGGDRSVHSTYAPDNRSSVFGIPVTRLQGCVRLLAAGEQVLLVDVASYQGTPATVIVTRASATGPEQVWVVRTGCSDTHSDLLTHVILAAAAG